VRGRREKTALSPSSLTTHFSTLTSLLMSVDFKLQLRDLALELFNIVLLLLNLPFDIKGRRIDRVLDVGLLVGRLSGLTGIWRGPGPQAGGKGNFLLLALL
jgi:hypothetical protein